MLKLYGFKKVNAVARGNTRDLRILWALEEMQIPFELVGMDHPAHDLNTDAYRRISPFEQIPVIGRSLNSAWAEDSHEVKVGTSR